MKVLRDPWDTLGSEVAVKLGLDFSCSELTTRVKLVNTKWRQISHAANISAEQKINIKMKALLLIVFFYFSSSTHIIKILSFQKYQFVSFPRKEQKNDKTVFVYSGM
jgi:hypothetical protein